MLRRFSAAVATNREGPRSTPAVTDLVAGQVQVMFDVTPTSLAHIKAGKLRPLGVTTTEPLPFLSDVPTIDSFLKGYVRRSQGHVA
jgi:tripartite-type tricarboxylate transporter receptor subunit TctC